MKKNVGLLLIFILYGCATKSNYSKSLFDNMFYDNKSIYFRLDPKGEDELEWKGFHQNVGTTSRPPNIEKLFKKSIEELAFETKLKIDYLDYNSTVLKQDVIIIDVKITKLLWKFGFSTVVMYADATYSVPNVNVYNIKGSQKNIGGGNSSNCIRKALKNTTYNFLKEYEK